MTLHPKTIVDTTRLADALAIQEAKIPAVAGTIQNGYRVRGNSLRAGETT
ncbi:hypothetical protein [Desulfotignum balticum]|nr:hypothetical protein [Desulfotignum balticum]